MTLYHIMSDLHFEFGRRLELLRPLSSDVLVLAGDIGSQDDVDAICQRVGPGSVIRINGNHEYYTRGVLPEATRIASNVGGVPLRGATMWFPPTYESYLESGLRDFDYVSGGWVAHEFAADMCFLEHEPADVIVTHHLPHRRSIASEYANSPINCFFLNPLAMRKLHPKLWIHGHTHTRFDYVENDTRVVCNPLGYKSERTGFDPEFVVEVTP